ncbi:hypothetical protein [Desulfosporosinus sp. BG]|uniref:hypothetical protein n=1 Tax=Desulfosporosinus sp. BG TaxID=1633135 RepID=UPI001FA6D720|nr:hypothetical protein [Desulfosporosinus sp. BG]
MAFKKNKLRAVFWMIILFAILTGTYYWLSFRFFINLTRFWLVGIILSFALVFILHKILKLWKVPIVIIGLDLIYHYNFTSIGEVAITYYLIEIPFIILTILFTIWIYIFYKLKKGIEVSD